MKKEFYDIFKDLYEEFGYLALPRYPKYYKYRIRPIREIKEKIDDAIRKLYLINQLRPDAKYFLLTNFYQLVVLPNFHPFSPKFNEDIESKLMDYIFEDLLLVLTSAKHIVGQEKEITSHAIFKSIVELWNKLKVNKLEIWG
ncbi:MAG: hypothetical protein ACFFDN_27955 [Candidatus Hodarchaeota archaeon]